MWTCHTCGVRNWDEAAVCHRCEAEIDAAQRNAVLAKGVTLVRLPKPAKPKFPGPVLKRTADCILGSILALVFGGVAVIVLYYCGKLTGRWEVKLAFLPVCMILLAAGSIARSIFRLVGGLGVDGWQSQVSPRTARGIGYTLLGLGVAVLAYGVMAGHVCWIGGVAGILASGAVFFGCDSVALDSAKMAAAMAAKAARAADAGSQDQASGPPPPWPQSANGLAPVGQRSEFKP